MQQSFECDSVSSCSETDETFDRQDLTQEQLTPDEGSDNTKKYSLEKSSPSSSTTLKDDSSDLPPHGEPVLPPAISQLLLDLLLTLPAIAFTVYANLVSNNDGKPIDAEPVLLLRTAAGYGPTILPIVFAAVAANLLKSIAAWKLERGISVLNLELLLRSRTVFSSIASPISLRAFNGLTPLIVALWALSPLGGQAALRVVDAGPSSHDWPFWYLNIHNDLPYLGSEAVLPSAELGLAVAAFSAALASPLHTKTAQQDVFGHVKIPMIEPFLVSNTTDENGWYEVGKVGNATEIVYLSLPGLPTTPDSGFESRSNYTFQLQTSYMNTKCNLSKNTQIQPPGWEEYVERRFKMSRHIHNSTYSNNRTLLIEDPPRELFYKTPRELKFTSYTPGTITNATCQLRAPFVQLEIACHRAACSATYIRPWEHPESDTVLTVLDGQDTSDLSILQSQAPAFLSTLVNASLAYWDPSPIELYFLKPDSPFYYSYENPPIWNVGEEVFSQRFSQLLNTFWIISVAPFDALNNLTLQERRMSNIDLSQLCPDYLEANGTRTTKILVLKVDRVWLVILVITSLSMLLAALAAAILNALRRGPDILGHLTYLIRDSPYLDGTETHTSMEDGINYTRRLKNVRICLGNVKADQERGYIAIGTMDKAVPLKRQKYDRFYE